MREINKKLISAILVLSLIASAVLGCLSVSAASSNTYAIVANSVASGTKKTTVQVTLTSDNGIKSGVFDLMFGSDVIDDVNFDENGNYVTPVNETVDEFRARDVDGNKMIAGVNYYKEEEYQSPIYNDEGDIIDYETKTRIVIDAEKSYKENSGNKGVLLPNAYDGNKYCIKLSSSCYCRCF